MKKNIFILSFVCLTFSSYGQSIYQIDSLVSLIDRTIFSDSILVDSNNCSKNKTVTGYISNDSIKKIEVVFDSSKSYTIYFWHFYPTYNTLIYVKEKVNQRESQYYFCGDTIIIDSKKHYIYDNSDTIFDLDSRFDYFEFLVKSQIIDNKAEHFYFIVKLIEIPKGINSCGGVIPSGAAFKYEVIETDYENYTSKYVIIKTACPPLYGDDFFVAGSKYKISAATNNGASFSIMIRNEYTIESIPEFWSRRIEKIE